MKKLMLVGGLILGTAIAYASQMGPYGYDEKGAQISTGLGIAQLTAAQIAALNPAYSGQMVMCSNCTNGGVGGASTGFNLCVSSGTGTGAYVLVSSNTAVCK